MFTDSSCKRPDPMKITIVQGAFFPVPPVLGGAVEKLWYGLGREFARLGHEVTHVSRSHPGFSDEERDGGVRYLRVRGEESNNNLLLLKFRDLRYTLRALRVLPEADILISNTFWLPLLCKDFSRGKIVVSVERMPKGQMKFYRRASLFRACSSVVAEAVGSGLPPDDIRVRMIPNPLPHVPESPCDLSEKKSLILYVGRIHPEKGLHHLIEASRNLPAPWKTLIVGPHEESQGGGGDAYLRKLRDAAIGSPVEFHGPIYKRDPLTSLFRDASLFVYPTVAGRGEAMPIAPLEAMAEGCVPVVPEMACFRDYIRNRVNGRMYHGDKTSPATELHAVLQDLIANPEERRRLAERAVEVRETHSPEKIATSFLDSFAELLPGRLSS